MKKSEMNCPEPSSFRDPAGFLFYKHGILYRQINEISRENYDNMTGSGLYQALVDLELMVAHEEVNIERPAPAKAYKVIRPEVIPFVSYPYEWCFTQLKEAALTTIKIEKKALDSGMSLKDCSAYNIQFRRGKPVFIDTLSFEKYDEGQPWVAYRQFCQHFLAPLALMCYKDIRLNQLLRIYIDGVPLDLASSLLSSKTRLLFPILTHIHLHAKTQSRFADKSLKTSKYKVSRRSLLGIVDSLWTAVNKMKWRPKGTEWAMYYNDTNYSTTALDHKEKIVSEFLDKLNPGNVWDLGANTGLFSRISSRKGILTVSFDIDPAAVEKNYLECVEQGETKILPLLLDLTNPSPGIGWQNLERMTIFERGPADTVFALALIHHLAISNNLPLGKIAEFFYKITCSLIIEFIPKDDSQVQRLLSSREDIFPEYTQQAFECEFNKYFTIQESVKIKESERTIYLMTRWNP